MLATNKSWTSPVTSTKKFLSRLITYRLSRHLEPGNFEAVFEGSLDLFNGMSAEPDVVIYQKNKGFVPVVAIEICKHDDYFETSLWAKDLFSRYRLNEFFIYVADRFRWFRFDRNSTDFIPASVSNMLHITLDETAMAFPKTGVS